MVEFLNLNDHSLVLTMYILPIIMGVFLLIERLIFSLRLSLSLQLSLNDPKRKLKSMASIRAGIIIIIIIFSIQVSKFIYKQIVHTNIKKVKLA